MHGRPLAAFRKKIKGDKYFRREEKEKKLAEKEKGEEIGTMMEDSLSYKKMTHVNFLLKT